MSKVTYAFRPQIEDIWKELKEGKSRSDQRCFHCPDWHPLRHFSSLSLTCLPAAGKAKEDAGNKTPEKGAIKAWEADVVSLGDTWMGPAIRQGLIQPLPDGAERTHWWKTLPPR